MSDACYCDFDGPEFVSITRPIARKSHKCCECGCAIDKGDRYEYVAGKWEGYLDTFKICVHCLVIRDHIDAGAECFCWAYGGLFEGIREWIDYQAYTFKPGYLFGVLRLLAMHPRRAGGGL